MKKTTIGTLILTATILTSQLGCSTETAATISTVEAQRTDKEFLNLEGRPRPNGFTHTVTSAPGRMIFVSGQGGSSPDGEMASDFATQAVNTFKNLQQCLEMAGATFDDVVKINYYLRDIDDLTELRKVRANYLNMDQPPAATAVQTGLGGNMLLEVEAVAIVPE